MTKFALLVIAATALQWAPAQAATEIRDPETMNAFAGAVIKAGYNCPRVVSVSRLDYQDERGQPFMVACNGGPAGFFYRVSVQPRGTVLVEPWR